MSVCAAPTCSHQSFDGSSYYVDVDVDVSTSITISITQSCTWSWASCTKQNIEYPCITYSCIRDI